MDKKMYIQTDNTTYNLVELLLLKMERLEQKECTIPKPIHPAQLYTESEVADLLKVTKRAVFNLRKENKIHFRDLKIGIRYSLEDIMEFIERCKR